MEDTRVYNSGTGIPTEQDIITSQGVNGLYINTNLGLDHEIPSRSAPFNRTFFQNNFILFDDNADICRSAGLIDYTKGNGQKLDFSLGCDFLEPNNSGRKHTNDSKLDCTNFLFQSNQKPSQNLDFSYSRDGVPINFDNRNLSAINNTLGSINMNSHPLNYLNVDGGQNVIYTEKQDFVLKDVLLDQLAKDNLNNSFSAMPELIPPFIGAGLQLGENMIYQNQINVVNQNLSSSRTGIQRCSTNEPRKNFDFGFLGDDKNSVINSNVYNVFDKSPTNSQATSQSSQSFNSLLYNSGMSERLVKIPDRPLSADKFRNNNEQTMKNIFSFNNQIYNEIQPEIHSISQIKTINSNFQDLKSSEQKSRHRSRKDQIFVCPYSGCTNTYQKINFLRSHIKTHTNYRPFKCEYCNFAFARKHDLKRHTRIHTGDKPHKCAHCERSFSRTDALSRHLFFGPCSKPSDA
ncbi:Transcriptional regulator prz1 [Smittium mucronatum]|uniref:Transcriptional regulator prz1 n=1 Tax=Smittium mucronatum TaxID=133383 RepID=A0A1R0GQR2_9FUNG|nr:Transcriptional regulator prz1 [Smittium mucronatum]